MDGRAGFAVGGVIAGAAAVAVACLVTLSNSAALADVPGAALKVDAVRVAPPAAGIATPTPTPTATPAPEVSVPAPTAEVVPAPEPQDVAAPPRTTPVAPAAPATPAAPAAPAQSESEVAAEAVKSGSWDRLREWAAAHGWTQEKVDRWIEDLRQKTSHGGDLTANRTQAPADEAGSPSTSDESSSRGWKRDQSPKPPHGD